MNEQGSTLNRRSEGAGSPPQARRWRAFSLLAVAYCMTAIDLTIVNVALSTIGLKLHFPQDDAVVLAERIRGLQAAGVDGRACIGRELRERVRRDHSVAHWADGVLEATR